MATPTVYKDVKVYSGGYDISGSTNKLSLEYAFDEVEATCFGDAVHWSLPGLPKLTFDLEGLATSDGSIGSEDILAAKLGTLNAPTTWSPTGADGTVAYFAKTMLLRYAPGGAVGDLYRFSASGVGQSVLNRGTILATGAKTSTGSGTARQLGAVGTAQQLYACLHVLAASGTNPTLDLIVESDDAQGFGSGVTRATFTQATSRGAEYLAPISGPITDTWWRARWTIGGSTPSFTFVVVMAIA